MRDHSDLMNTPENSELRRQIREAVQQQDGRLFVAICDKYGKLRVEQAIAFDYDPKDDFDALIALGIDLVHIIQSVHEALRYPYPFTGESDSSGIPF